MYRKNRLYLIFFLALLTNQSLPQNAYTYCNSGLEYFNRGEYEDAKEYFLKAVTSAADEFGKDTPNYAVYLNYLACSYKQLDNFYKAESLFVAAKELSMKHFSAVPDIYISVSNNLGNLFLEMAKYPEAEELLIETISRIDDSHPEYQKIINNLAILYEHVGKSVKADSLLRSLDSGKNLRGIELANYFNTRAAFFFAKGELEESLDLMNKAVQVADSSISQQSVEYSNFLNNLATIYKELKRFEEAEEVYFKSLKLKENLGIHHPSYLTTLGNLARMYTDKGDYNKAEAYYLQVNHSITFLTNKYFPYFSENEKTNFWNSVKNNADLFNTFATIRLRDNPGVSGEMYNYQLNTKALLLSTTNQVKRKILSSEDSTLISLYTELVETKNNFARFFNLPPDEALSIKSSIDSLTIKITSMEKELSNKASAIIPAIIEREIKWEDIQKKLKENEAAVEIIRYNYNSKSMPGTIYYAAIIIKPKLSYPEVILLKNGNELEGKYLKYYQRSIKSKIEDPHSFNQYWRPLEKTLEGMENVYFSPDGVYNQINIKTLKSDSGKFVIDDKKIIWVSNTKDIIELKERMNDTTSLVSKMNAVLFGAPNFYIEQKSKIETTPSSSKKQFSYNLDDVLIKNLSNLPGTELEISRIKSTLETANFNVQVFVGDEATEGTLKKIKNPGILHIATHGYFLPDVNTKTNEFENNKNNEFIENPLIRSGLILAGIKNRLSDSFISQTEEDELLTAYEAMNLQLDSTDLVVLSACETASGEIVVGEGVYGLQRAFQSAGAKTTVISLWKIDDMVTQEIMTLFYDFWLKTGSIYEGFRKAELSIKEKYKNPYFWGSFVMYMN
ncbi:MAG: CHAT domain-containing protein [Ignavibacteria bacterium]|nr:CHAT domain-containing protein [Ignavibacteria bacterium]